MAGILEQRPQWKPYWLFIQESAARFGMNPNETLAVHIFENEAADPGVRGPIAKGAQAVGLAQIWDKTVSAGTNRAGWNRFAGRWNLRDGQNIEHLKENPEFAIDYLAWRMAGLRGKHKDVDSWYRGPGYNPGFTGDARGPGPSIYLADNARTRIAMSPDLTPSPVAGANLPGDITSVWGDPRDGGARKHEGVDIAAPYGTPLIAVADGTVRLTTSELGGEGLYIKKGGVEYYYAHLSGYNVADGQKVRKGDVVGYVGNSGASSTGPHLHFSIFEGTGNNRRAIDPYKFLMATESMPAGTYSANPAWTPGEGLAWPGELPETAGGLPSGLAGDPGGLPGDPLGLPGDPFGLPGDPFGLPGGVPGDSGQGASIRSTWQVIAQQENSGPEAKAYAGIPDDHGDGHSHDDEDAA